MTFPCLTGNDGARLSLRERVYRYLAEWLQAADRRAGEGIDQHALCRALRISRTPLRDALLRLELEGLVEIRPRQGVFVRSPSPAEVMDICRILGLLEADALERRFPGPQGAFLRPLALSLRQQQAAARQGDDVLFHRAERDFHCLLTGWANAHSTARLVAPLLRRLDMLPRRPEHAAGRRAGVIGVHKRLLDSLACGNLTAAASILRQEYWLSASFPGHLRAAMSSSAVTAAAGPRSRSRREDDWPDP